MTEDPQDKEYLDLFKPKSPEGPQPEPAETGPDPGVTQPSQPLDEEPVDSSGFVDAKAPSTQEVSGFQDLDPTLRTVGLVAGGGCLLLLLTAVVIFAFFQVFGRDGEEQVDSTGTPTSVVSVTSTPVGPAIESPLIVPLVSSGDVRVPVVLPERLIVGERVWTVQAVNAPAEAWPEAPASDDSVSWAYGTVVNYILRLASTPESRELLSGLQGGDALNLYMSTGLALSFNVSEVVVGEVEGSAFFGQATPQLTLALIADDPSQSIVVTASFFDAESSVSEPLSGAVAGVIGTPVDRGPVRVTVLEAYHVMADDAGLPPGTGYLLVDLRVENLDAQTLDTEYFQTFVSDAVDERYPLTTVAAQFAHYGVPSGTLAPGETVIGSLGYLVPRNPEGHVRWAFNPLPGSKNWVLVPVPYDLPPPTPTSSPPPPVGFAQVALDSEDIIVDRIDNELVIGLEIVNQSSGQVEVTEGDISLSSFPAGEAELVSAGPLLPWIITPGERRLFELHFELPSDDPVLLTVLGYSFEIANLGGQ